MSRRGWVLALLGVVVLVVLFVLSPRPTPPWAITSTAPNGTDILRRILADEFDVEMIATGPMATIDDLTAADLVVVFEHRLEAADERAIAGHIAEGGHAIVAVDAPSLTGLSRSGTVGTVGSGGGTGSSLAGTPNCELLPGTSVGFRPGPYTDQDFSTDIDLLEVVADGTPAGPDGGAATVVDTCWGSDGGAYLVVLAAPSGGGMLVMASPFGVSNAAIAGRSGTTALVPLFVPDDGGRVLVVRGNAVPIQGDTAPDGAVPDRLIGGMYLLGLAALLYVVANLRRLGPVLTEEPVVRVPAAELAVGVADLLQRHHHAGHAAAHVRAGLRGDLDRLLGTFDATDDEVATLVARTSGLDTQAVRRAVVERAVPDDVDLVAVVGAVHLVRDRLGLAQRPSDPSQPAEPETSSDPSIASQRPTS